MIRKVIKTTHTQTNHSNMEHELTINITIAHINLLLSQFVPLQPLVETSMLELPPDSILS